MNAADTFHNLEARGIRWSVFARTLGEHPRTLTQHHPERVLRSASTAKILVLIEAARMISSGDALPTDPLDRNVVDRVADSGLWQHLLTDKLPFADVARLVGTVSDNWATNVLVHRVGGVSAIEATATELGIADVNLHDIVRDVRVDSDSPTLSSGSAHGYAELCARLSMADRIDPSVATVAWGWLHDGADLSMVASAFGLDPLSHSQADRGFTVVNKTGTDIGTRADVGVIVSPTESIAYGCIANWDEGTLGSSARDDVLAAMRAFGTYLRHECTAPAAPRGSETISVADSGFK